MKKLATALCVTTLAGLSSIASAGEYAVYSSSEYCELERTKSTQMDDRYLRAYAKKLGATPSTRLCTDIHNGKYADANVSSVSWSYFQNKPYQGSIISLSSNVIKRLRAENIEVQEVFE